MAHQASKARTAQRTRQIKLKQHQPAKVLKRVGRTKLSVKKTMPAIKAGIPVGLAALAKQQQEKRKLAKEEKKKAGSQNSPFQKVNPPKFTAVGKLGKLSV